MKTVTVVATMNAKPGKEGEMKELLRGLLTPTRKERGCISYDLHENPEQPGKFLFYENWESKALLDAHLKSKHMAAAFPQIKKLSATEPVISLWEKLV
jgi:quinol monooxygenase YgiN